MIFHTVGHDFRHDEDFRLLRPNGLKEYLLLIIRSDAWFVINNGKTQSISDAVIVLKAGTPHCFGARGGVYVNDWVAFSFDGDRENFLFDKIVFDRLIESEKMAAECSDIVKLMQKENLFGGKNKEQLLNLLFRVILLRLQGAFDCECDHPTYNRLSEIRGLIYNNPAENYSIQTLADMAYMSKSYFQHLYKQLFHTTPIQDEIVSRINYAKQLLFTTNYSIKTIAGILHYENDVSFIKQFRQMTGESPGQYRKHYSG